MTRVIETRYWAKPIPLRGFDWEATLSGWDLGEPIGYGTSEEEAIEDLRSLLEDRS